MARTLVSWLLILFCAFAPAHAQGIKDPTTWTQKVKSLGDGKYELSFRVELDSGWHIWSMTPGGDGLQIPPSVKVDTIGAVVLMGAAEESGPAKHVGKMDGIDGDVAYFDREVEYTQIVKASAGQKLKGRYQYQVCNDRMCLPPKTQEFTLDLP